MLNSIPLTMVLFVLIIGSVGLALLMLKTKFPSIARRYNYHYARKHYFMTRSESDFFAVLMPIIEQNYIVFAQVHLPTLLSHKIKGQHWQGALSHIDRKSVDFVICDKKYLSPKLVIELDDASHERVDRQLRDQEVEWIFEQAQIPLLRIPNRARFDRQSLAQQLAQHDIF